MRARGIAMAAAIAVAGMASAASAECAAPQDRAAVSAALLERVNSARAAAGLAPLELSYRLSQAAQAHACDMARRGFMGHEGSDGSDFMARIVRQDFRPCHGAENVARGQRGVAAVMDAWMGSPPHRRNLLRSRFEAIGLGIGFADQSGGRPHWVIKLADRC